jgi:hypothetical protein
MPNITNEQNAQEPNIPKAIISPRQPSPPIEPTIPAVVPIAESKILLIDLSPLLPFLNYPQIR